MYDVAEIMQGNINTLKKTMDEKKFENIREKIRQSELKLEKSYNRLKYYQLLIDKSLTSGNKEDLQAEVHEIGQEMDSLFLDLECLKTELEILRKLT